MPQFPSQNLNTQKICESYPQLLQIYSSSLVLNGTGSQITFLNLTASYALNSPSTIGTSGTSGLSYGTSGTTGTSGTSGQSGASGSNGTSGVNGSSGTSGSSGSSGSSGTSGVSGTSGSSGNSGSSGTSGSSGSSGSSGNNGTSGVSGLLNLTGSTTNGLITYNGYGNSATVQNNVTYTSNTLYVTGSLKATRITSSFSGSFKGRVTASGIATYGNIIPLSPSASLGTVQFPFKSVNVSSGSITLANANPLIPAVVLSNNLGNLDVSSGGIRLIQANSSFIAPTASFSYLSGTFKQVGNRTLFGNDIISGSSTVSGLLSGSRLKTNQITSSTLLINSLTTNNTGYYLTVDNATGNVYKSVAGASGSSGTSGNSGSSGTSGNSGSSGSSGTSGANGTSGTSGSSGSSGTAGSSGTSGTSGTSGVNGVSGGAIYYFNESVTQTPYKELSITPTAAAEQSVPATIAKDVTATIQSYLTDTNLPNVTAIPAGIWSFFLHAYKSTNNSSFDIFCEVYKRSSGGAETLLFTTDPVAVTSNSPTPSMVTTDTYQSGYSLNLTDRILVKVRATNTSNQSHTITFVTEGTTHYSFAQTTLGIFSGTSGTSGSSGSAGTSGTSVSVSGTTNTIVKFTSATTIGNTSTPIFESGSKVGIGNTNPRQKLHITQEVDTSYPTLGTGKGALFIAGSTNLYGLYLGIDTAIGNSYLQGMRNDGITSAYDIFLNPAGGNVTIGATNSLGNKLYIRGGTELLNSSGSTGSTTSASLMVVGQNTKGGSTYHDFLYTRNSKATLNPNKHFRQDNTGNLEIINSAYGANIFTLTDSGSLVLPTAQSRNVTQLRNTGAGLKVGSFGLLFDDGNVHLHSTSPNSNLWLNCSGSGMFVVNGQSGATNGMCVGTSIQKGFVTIVGSVSAAITQPYGYLISSGAGSTTGTSPNPYSLTCDSRIMSSEFNAPSDERLKNIKGEISLDKAVDFVTKIDPIEFTWKEGVDTGLKAGYSAQQTYKAGFEHLIGVVPKQGMEEIVEPDGFISPKDAQFVMNYEQVTPYHSKLIKHLLDKIEQLENRISQLESK
jgi:hypothetical protein